MIINGFQKLTLLDFPAHTAAIVFTAGCDLRCPFCHNAPLVSRIRLDERIDEGEVFSYLEKRFGILDGVCVSGGEPLLQKDIFAFLERVKDMGYDVKLDTNGSSPERLREVIDRGLADYVAMDIKNAPELYQKTTGIGDLDIEPFSKSRDILLSSSVDYEFRTTVTSELHTPKSIAAAAEWIKGAKRYFIQNFKDSGDTVGEGMTPCSQDVLEAMKTEALKFVENVNIR
ncbi:MAG: anaerobic ribonucleoside-triphosphate reductase activating protein [Clostridia bacterium]|nr:anaerobic ribonucleoside-triphosphate reductase activating protein [Clostridia bacterium]